MPAQALRKLAVDAMDVAILAGLVKSLSGRFQSETKSIEAVAREHGMHPNTVFARVKRMKEAGWGFPLVAIPTIGGLSGARFFVPLTMARRTDALLAEVLKIGCVFNIMDHLEGWEITVCTVDDQSVDALVEQIRVLVGAEAVVMSLHAKRDWPPLPDIELDETDLAIFEALLSDPLASMDALAATLGAHKRTVQRHHERLREGGAFRIYFLGGGAMATGLAWRYVQVGLPPPGIERQAAESELQRLIPNTLARHGLVHGAWFLLYGDDQGELQAQVEQAATIPGVTVLFDRQFRRFIPNPDYPRQMMGLLRSRQMKHAALAKRVLST